MNSIGDFAQNLILDEVSDIQTGKISPPSMSTNTPQQAPAGKDIREVKVPATFMQEILGEEFVPPSEGEELVNREQPPTQKPQEPNSLIISENKVDELTTLLKEVKDLLLEMTMAATTTGQIGVNLGAKTVGGKLKPQRGYAPSLKPTLPSNVKTAKDVLRHSISKRKRISKRNRR